MRAASVACACVSLTLSLSLSLSLSPFLSRSFSLRLSLSPSLSLSLACVQITYISECVRVCVLSYVCVYFLGQAEAACDDELLCRRAHATNTLSILHSSIHHIDPQNTHTDNPDVGGAAPYRHSAGAHFTRFTTSTKVQILTQPLQHTPTNFNTPTKGLTPIGTPTLAHSANAALALSDSPNGSYLRHMAGLRSGVSRAASADGWATAPGTPVLLPPLVYEALSHWCMRP